MGSEEVEKEKNSKTGLVKTIAKAIFSHFGLCVIVIVYCIVGGVLFEMLEKENEITACVESRGEYLDMENDTLFSLLDVIITNPLGSPAADAQILGVFESFRNNSFSIGYDGSWCEGYGEPDGPMHEWNLAGGIFFSMTVITTIGYGHISPKTIWGRILCISYAMLGIPIMLMFLTNVGDVLADVFKYVYAKIICCGCLRRKKKKKREDGKNNGRMNDDNNVNDRRDNGTAFTDDNSSPRAPSRISIFERVSSAASRYSGGQSSSIKHFAVENGSTGSSDSLAGDTGAQAPGSAVTHRGNAQNTKIKAFGAADIAARANRMRTSSSKSTDRLIVDDDSDDEDADEEEWEEISKIAVPLTISLGIIGLYILGGAVLFKYWEGWDMLQASYFCFITLSTIGFGDVTPGRDFSDPMANARLIIGSVYSIFGMAILSMCFTLMQEEMLSKFQWIGRKMGVVQTEEEEDELLEKAAVDQNNRNQSEC